MGKSKKEDNVRRQLYTIYLVSFIDFFGVSLVIPNLSAHLLSLGASHFHIGLMSSVYSLMQLLSGPFLGSWSDVSGRKNVLMYSIIVCSVGYFILGFSNVLFVIFLSRFFLGMIKSTQSLSKTVIADTIPPDQQLEAYGLFTSITSLGFVIGPSVGGHLAEISDGFFYSCCLTSLLFCVNAIIVFFFIEDPCRSSGNQNAQQSSVLNQIKLTFSKLISIKWEKHYSVFLIRFLTGISVFLFFFNYTSYMKDTFKMSPSAVGYTVSFQGMISSFAGFCFKFVHFGNSGAHRCFYLLLLLSASFLFLILAQSFTFFMCSIIPLFVSHSLLRVVTIEMALEDSDYSERGSLNGAFYSVMSISRLLAPVISGCIIDTYGYKAVLCISFLLCACAAVFCKSVCSNKEKSD